MNASVQAILDNANLLQALLDIGATGAFPMSLLNLQARPWLQTQDSPGLHQAASITPGTPMRIQWQTTKRPSGNWDNLYIYNRNGLPNASLYASLVGVTLPNASDVANCNNLENETQKCSGPYIFNSGIQLRRGDSTIRVFDYTTAHTPGNKADPWITTGCKFDPAVYTAGKLIATLGLFYDDGHAIYWLGIGVNGIWNPFARSFPGFPVATAPYLNNAVQYDSLNNGAQVEFKVNYAHVIPLL